MKPRGSAAWDKDVAWFDFSLASLVFMTECGSGITLISIEVADPNSRYIEAHFQIDRQPRSLFFAGVYCACAAMIAGRIRVLAEKARRMREEIA